MVLALTQRRVCPGPRRCKCSPPVRRKACYYSDKFPTSIKSEAAHSFKAGSNPPPHTLNHLPHPLTPPTQPSTTPTHHLPHPLNHLPHPLTICHTHSPHLLNHLPHPLTICHTHSTICHTHSPSATPTQPSAPPTHHLPNLQYVVLRHTTNHPRLMRVPGEVRDL